MQDTINLVQRSSRKFQIEIDRYCATSSTGFTKRLNLFSQLISAFNYSDLIYRLEKGDKPFYTEPNLSTLISYFDKRGSDVSAIQVSNALINSFGRDNIKKIFPEIEKTASLIKSPLEECIYIRHTSTCRISSKGCGIETICLNEHRTIPKNDLQSFYLALCGQTDEDFKKIVDTSIDLQYEESEFIIRTLIAQPEFVDLAADAIIKQFEETISFDKQYDDVYNYFDKEKSLYMQIIYAFEDKLSSHKGLTWDVGIGDIFVSYLNSTLSWRLRNSLEEDNFNVGFTWGHDDISSEINFAQKQFHKYIK